MTSKRKYDPKESVTRQLSDEAIHKIQNIISSELDGIDDLELGITYYDNPVDETDTGYPTCPPRQFIPGYDD